MEATHKFKIPYDKALYQSIRDKQIEAGKCWTDLIRYANGYYFTCKKWIKKSELESMTKNTYNLAAQSVQALVAKYDDNRKSTLELRKTNKKIKYPWKHTFFQSVPYKKASMDLSKDKIILKNSDYQSSISLVHLSKIANKKRKSKKDQALFENIPKSKDYIEIPNLANEDISSVSYAEIVYKKGSYWFHYVIDVPEKKNTDEFKVAGCDLGEIHSLTISTEDKALIESGRAIRSIKQYRAKMIAHLTKKMSKCKRLSRQWKKYQRAKKKMLAKTNAQLEYLYHKSTKETIDFLIQEEVTDFVVGNPKGIEKSTNKNVKKKKKTTKSRRQQLSSWSYGIFKSLLKYKSKMNGINIYFVNEAYTSQNCPFCGGRHKANGRNFTCSDTNQKIHRDVNGAQNIARKLFEMDTKSVDVLYRQPIWYKRFYHENKSIACGMA